MSQTKIFLAIEAKRNAVCPGQQPSLPLGLWPRWAVIKQGCAESAPHISCAASTRTLSFIYAALRRLFCIFFYSFFFPFASTSLIHMSVFMSIHLAACEWKYSRDFQTLGVFHSEAWCVDVKEADAIDASMADGFWVLSKYRQTASMSSYFPFSEHGRHIKKHLSSPLWWFKFDISLNLF